MNDMAESIPESQLQFIQLVAKNRLVSPDDVHEAIDLFHRYQKAGGEVPSIGRILVAKGWLNIQRAEALLRHVIFKEPLNLQISEAADSGATKPPSAIVPALPSAEFEEFEDVGLEPPGSNVDLHVSGITNRSNLNEKQELIQGLGALILPPELTAIKEYKITQVIGEGAMGVVYRAHQVSMDRIVALKVLPAARTKDQRFVEEFLTEARNAGRLNHPNLIRVHEVVKKDVGKSGEIYYYSMEYVEGQRLDEWMDECEGGRLNPKEAIDVFVQVAAALDYGYRFKVIHREIRPNTIMVAEDGQAKLADLGLTKGESTRFLDGENAYYVAPEQAKGLPVDTRTDIYSLGCCLFHCLTGEAPFWGGPPKEVLNRRFEIPTPDPCEMNPDVPADIAEIVVKMMARDPMERYQTPAEVMDALKRIAAGYSATTLLAKPLPSRPNVKKPFKSRYGSPRRGAQGGNKIPLRAGRVRRKRYRP